MGVLEVLKSTARVKELIDWPDKNAGIKVVIKTLTEQDFSEAKRETDKLFKDRKIGAENADAYEAEFETQLLHRAIFDPENEDKPLCSITEFRGLLRPEIKDALAEKLDNLHEENSPDPDKLSDEKYNAVVAEVKKNAEKAVMNISSINTLKRLIVTLASQPPS